MLESLLKKFEIYKDTCPITNLRDGCVSFTRNKSYSKYVENTDKDVWIIASKEDWWLSDKISSTVKCYFIDNPEYYFTLYHNFVHKNDIVSPPIIGNNTIIHDTVVLNIEGLKVVYGDNNKKIQFKHVGNIVIGNDVEIGALSVVHRGTMGSTVVRDGVKIGAKVNIAHNNDIGENTVIAVGVITNGSVKIGKNCWISSGVLIRNGVSICDDVVIGLGSVVIKDINSPGIYVGNPAKYLGPKKERWNF